MRGEFLSPLVTKHVGAQRKVLVQALVYRARCGRVWRVPAGTPSDGASVPRVLWALYPAFGGAYEPAAWLHDFLYATGGAGELSREEVDALMLEASVDGCGFRGRGAVVMHLALRLWGWLAWRRYRRAAAAAAALELV